MEIVLNELKLKERQCISEGVKAKQFTSAYNCIRRRIKLFCIHPQVQRIINVQELAELNSKSFLLNLRKKNTYLSPCIQSKFKHNFISVLNE